MRLAITGTGLVKIDGNVVGFGLGADYASEHEEGINPLRSKFGVGNGGKYGVEARTTTQVPPDFGFDKHKKFTQFYCTYLDESKNLLKSRNTGLRLPKPYKEEEANDPRYLTVTAWGRSDFGVYTKDGEIAEVLQEIYNGMLTHNVMLSLSTNGFLIGSTGLTFTLINRIPDKIKENMRMADLEREELHNAWEALGLEKELKDAGRTWYALRPRRFANPEKTDFVVILNPCNQKKYNYGHFSVEELRQWAQGEGPIIKK